MTTGFALVGAGLFGERHAQAYSRHPLVDFAAVCDLDEARAQFEASVAADPKLAAAWSNLGNIHKLQGRLKPASVAYEKAIALDPALADAPGTYVLEP